MGEHLFVVSALTLFMFFWIDVFRKWYARFLMRRGMSRRNVNSMMRILWIILAILFWYTLLHRGMPAEFNITHFSYTLFIFSLYGFLREIFFRRGNGDEN